MMTELFSIRGAAAAADVQLLRKSHSIEQSQQNEKLRLVEISKAELLFRITLQPKHLS